MKRLKKLLSISLAMVLILAMGTTAFAADITAPAANTKLHAVAQADSRAFNRTFSKSINSDDYTLVGLDVNSGYADDTLRVSVTDDGSAETQPIEFKLVYGDTTEYFTLEEGERAVKIDIGPGVSFDLYAMYVNAGETGIVKGKISLQQS